MVLAAQGGRDSGVGPKVLAEPPLIGGRVIHLGKDNMAWPH